MRWLRVLTNVIFIISTVTKIQTILRNMQENLASFWWWRLGKYLTVDIVDFRSLTIMSCLMLYLALRNSFLGMLWWLQCVGACWLCQYLQPTFQGEHAWFDLVPRSIHANTWELSLTCLYSKDLEHSDYYCPDCKAKTTCKRPDLQKLEPKEKYA